MEKEREEFVGNSHFYDERNVETEDSLKLLISWMYRMYMKRRLLDSEIENLCSIKIKYHMDI